MQDLVAPNGNKAYRKQCQSPFPDLTLHLSLQTGGSQTKQLPRGPQVGPGPQNMANYTGTQQEQHRQDHPVLLGGHVAFGTALFVLFLKERKHCVWNKTLVSAIVSSSRDCGRVVSRLTARRARTGGEGRAVWSLHALPVCAWVSSAMKNMYSEDKIQSVSPTKCTHEDLHVVP